MQKTEPPAGKPASRFRKRYQWRNKNTILEPKPKVTNTIYCKYLHAPPPFFPRKKGRERRCKSRRLLTYRSEINENPSTVFQGRRKEKFSNATCCLLNWTLIGRRISYDDIDLWKIILFLGLRSHKMKKHYWENSSWQSAHAGAKLDKSLN